MKTLVTLLVILALGSRALAAQERFNINTYVVPITKLTEQKETTDVEEALFKIDSTIGSVWRFDTNGFQRIIVRDLVSQKAFTESKRNQFLNRLAAIKIPHIDFQQESMSNVVAFLQEQIRKYDPTIARGSDEFIRLKYMDYSQEAPLITFTAKDISAFETLNIVTSVANLTYRLEDDDIVITPKVETGGPVTVRMYEVSPSLRERLTGTTISNVFTQLGFDMKSYTELKYSPELDIIVCGTTYWENQQFQRLLYLTGLAREEPGRFRLVSRSESGKNLLFLLDGKTGETWTYRATLTRNGRRKESFDLILTSWEPESEGQDTKPEPKNNK